jgi:hypothetical protein
MFTSVKMHILMAKEVQAIVGQIRSELKSVRAGHMLRFAALLSIHLESLADFQEGLGPLLFGFSGGFWEKLLPTSFSQKLESKICFGL